MRPTKPPLAIPSWNSNGDPDLDSPRNGIQEFSAASTKLILQEDSDQCSPEEETLRPTKIPPKVPDVNALKYEGAVVYMPLLPGQIRLFRLEPRNISDTQKPNQFLVQGVLEHHRLAEHPQYNALSYCWGRDTNSRPISVNGEIIAIHSNLETALRKLQSYRRDMLIWVDQLCINQNNNDEKTLQVQQMGCIYTEASLVFAWLGEAADDSDLLMDHIRTIGEDIVPESRSMLYTEGQLDRLLLAYMTPKSRRALSNAFKHFCQRAYWQRLWIIQEFVLAQEVVIVCGDQHVSYRQLLLTTCFIESPRDYIQGANALTKTHTQHAIEDIIEAIIQTYGASKPSFLAGVITYRNRHSSMECRSENDFFRVLVLSLVLEVDDNHPKSTDPRDRVFATLGLANNAEAFPMLPDYEHDWQHVYTELTKALLCQGHIDILSYCQFTEANPLLVENEKLPSWVPDWNLRIKTPCAGFQWDTYFTASPDPSNLQKVQVNEKKGHISLLGVTLDTISSIGNLWDPDWLAPLDLKAAHSYVSEVEQLCKRSSHSSVTSCELKEVVGRTCIADRICCEGSNSWWEDKDLYKDGYCDCYTNALAAFERGYLCTEEALYCRRLQLLHSRRPFISQTGLVGLAPSNVEVGDEICLFLRGKTPYIISKKTNGVSTLRGETFVHGIMYGEFWDLYENPDYRWIELK